MNVVALVGRIGNDPEMRYTPSGLAITKFRLGITRQRKSESGEQETDWLDIVTFGKTAEFVSQYLDKGAHVGVTGRIQSRTWEAQDGSKRYAVEIVAENVDFMESMGPTSTAAVRPPAAFSRRVGPWGRGRR